MGIIKIIFTSIQSCKIYVIRFKHEHPPRLHDRCHDVPNTHVAANKPTKTNKHPWKQNPSKTNEHASSSINGP